MKTHVVWVGR